MIDKIIDTSYILFSIMNPQQLFNNEHFFDSNSNDVFDELIDHIGSLLADEYFQIMESERQVQSDDEKKIIGELS